MHRDRPLDGSQQDRGRRDRAEYEADKFASFFLMPENLLRNRFRQLFLCDRFGIDEATAFALDPADKHRLLAEKKTPRDLSRILVSAATSAGNEIQLPVIRAGSITLAQLQFDSSGTPGLFGNHDELIDEWHEKLGMTTEARWGAAATASPGVAERPVP